MYNNVLNLGVSVECGLAQSDPIYFCDPIYFWCLTPFIFAGLSQSQFAHLLGVSVLTLQGWEQGRITPSCAAKTLIKIADKHPEVLLEVS